MMQKTRLALLARGFDAHTADGLIARGWTVGRLQQRQDAELRGLGLSEELLNSLRTGERPPIPTPTLTKLLFDNRFLCCVCRDQNKPIIVHHIVDWAISHSHEASNLAVLCLEHHNAAHITGGLTQRLDATTLRHLKAKWEAAVLTLDAKSILDSSRLEYRSWNYFNHMRLMEIANVLSIRMHGLSAADYGRRMRLVDAGGVVLPRNQNSNSPYMYDDGSGMALYNYMKDLFDAILPHLTILNISDYFDRGTLPPLLTNGDYIFAQGVHTFKSENSTKNGHGQITKGARRANHVEVQFIFDRWEATSTSAWGWLQGRQTAGSLIRVRGVEREGTLLRITGTVLALGDGFHDLKKREYSPFYNSYTCFDDEDDDTEDDFMTVPADPSDPF
jgi:hypothetical protein